MVHDLLHLEPRPEWLRFDDQASEAYAHLLAQPVAVVRRAPAHDSLIPIGIRGNTRAQRYAAWVAPRAILRIETPMDLRQRKPSRSLPAFEALRVLTTRWPAQGLAWGPTGSVGFELATGAPVVTASSDLDLQVRAEQPFSQAEAHALLAATRDLATAVDVQVETPHGGFALAEYAREGRCLLRTHAGPLLVASPWQSPAVHA